jgi:predicted AAA+ superfamily ATPase
METCFLWGPRQTGKTTLLKMNYPEIRRYDMLLSDVFERVSRNPVGFREECLNLYHENSSRSQMVIIDEIQKVPLLLDEIHWLMENTSLRFLLCGSSARKLKRAHGNLLGGRAIRYELFPLVSAEIPEFDLIRACNHGLLPRHYDSKYPQKLLQAYIGNYLKEEIALETNIRNLPAFNRFLPAAALTNGEMVNYTNIASDCGVSSLTVKEYFQILEDTMMGYMLPAFQKKAKRRQIRTSKFYFFDIGVNGYLGKYGNILPGSPLFGKMFEHLIINEIRAHSAYSEKLYPIAYWKTASGLEVDLILGECEIALEIKSTDNVNQKHLRNLRIFNEEFKVKRSIVVSLDSQKRITADRIEIIPWQLFLKQLWSNLIM